MYTTRVPRPRALRPRHSVISQWDVLLPLGIAPPDPEIDAPEMPDDPAASSAVARRLAEAGVTGHNPVIVVHVSAGNPFRRWPQESFVELVCRLASKDPKRRIILTSGPSDAAAAAAIARDARRRLTDEESIGGTRVRRHSIWRSCARSLREPRCTSGGTAARSTSQAPRACRLWDCKGRHCRCARSRFAARASSARRRKCRICRAARAINADASPAIFGASPAFQPRTSRHWQSAPSAGLKASTYNGVQSSSLVLITSRS